MGSEMCIRDRDRSLAQAHLQTVIVKFTSELVVVLRDSLSSCSSAFCEHGGKVISLRVDLLLASRFTHVAFEGVRVNYGLDFGTALVDHVVGRGEIALLKSVLRRAMPREQVMLHAPLAVNHGGIVIGVL